MLPQPTLYPVDPKMLPKRTPQQQMDSALYNYSPSSPMRSSITKISNNTKSFLQNSIYSVIRAPSPQKLPQPVKRKVLAPTFLAGPGSYDPNFNVASTKSNSPSFSIKKQKRWEEEDNNPLVAPGKYTPNYDVSTTFKRVARPCVFSKAPRFFSSEENDQAKKGKSDKKSVLLEPNYNAVLKRSPSPATFGKTPKKMYYEDLMGTNSAPGVGKYSPNIFASSSATKTKCAVHYGKFPPADLEHPSSPHKSINSSQMNNSKLRASSVTPGPGAYEVNPTTKLLSVHQKTPAFSFFKSLASSHNPDSGVLAGRLQDQSAGPSSGSFNRSSASGLPNGSVEARASPGVGYYSPNYEFVQKRAPSTLLYLTSS